MNIIKNDVKPCICIPKNVGMGLDGLGYSVLKSPAIIFDAAEERNQTPIIKHENLIGDNLDTIDKPIGDIHSSPNVIIKYTATRYRGLTPELPASIIIAAGKSTINAKQRSNNPIIILSGIDGSNPLSRNLGHIVANMGAIKRINNGFID